MKIEAYNYEDMLLVILSVLLILAIGYYIFYYYNNYINSKPILLPNRIDVLEKDDIQGINKTREIKDIAPPKLVNLYNEDYKVLKSKNDIECTNKDSILLFNNNYKSDNDSFDIELMRPYEKNNIVDKDLNDVYNSKMSGNANNKEAEEIYDYSLKKQKTDLPIANIPVYALLDNKSLKLSEREMTE
jgi:hypothetical protein